MRTKILIGVTAALLACFITASGYLLLYQSNILEPTNQMEKLINSSPLIVAFGFIIFVVFACAMSLLIHSVTEPVRKLRDVADKIARGHLDAEIYKNGSVEVNDLANSFSTMVSKLRNLNSKYKDQYKDSSSLYRTVDKDGIISSCSKSYAERLGYTVDEVVGTHYNQHTAPEGVTAMTEEFDSWKKNESSKNIEIALRAKNGTTFPTLLSVNTFYDENGNLTGYNNTIRDISEIYEARKKIEQDKIREMQLAEVKKMEKLKDEFASMMTHELKTPLTPIMGHCEMLKESGLLGNLNDEQLNSINKISECALRLERLIGDVMLAQRLEIGQMNFDKQKFDVTKLMSDINNDYSQTMKEKQIEFVNSAQEEINLWTDKNRIRQVIDNLIQNAVDFTPKDNGRIEVGAKKEDDNVVFYVKDNGVGIPHEVQSTMFRKFYQVDASHRRKHTGTGLGLVICKGIVEGLGGKIWFESEPGKNTNFYFSIPQEVYWKSQIA